ncbi:MAG: hypothetical protein JWP06_745 [Candidatus Saccharibacteria bacterium]|nr:hypothetical protein [Candidatus Saccharibacteria bacterium]
MKGINETTFQMDHTGSSGFSSVYGRTRHFSG